MQPELTGPELVLGVGTAGYSPQECFSFHPYPTEIFRLYGTPLQSLRDYSPSLLPGSSSPSPLPGGGVGAQTLIPRGIQPPSFTGGSYRFRAEQKPSG